ncbi:MAG: sulfatase-like hydrolase/transferase [Bacteroidales bacterium]|jgi:phosphoglycerol transferase MdoB-like AlkP superfamily enzyme|nr:sulfatase-like hydrolase/transferase [Bacteroidales bacterium]
MARRKPSRTSKSKRKKGAKWFQGNIHMVMILKLLLMLVLLFLSRILFYLFNLGYFSSLSLVELLRIFVIGIRFDLSALLIINAPFILMNAIPFKFRYHKIYQVVANIFYYTVNIVALMGNFVDSIYFRFTLKRTTADIFQYLEVGGDFDKLVPQFLMDFWYILLVWIFFIVLLVYIGTRFSVVAPAGARKGFDFKFYTFNTIVFVVVAGLSVIGFRGGLQLRPISLVTAGNYTTAKNVPLLLNTPFALVKTFRHERLNEVTWFRKEKELANVYSPIHRGKSTGFKQLNVVIIIMESFSREHIGSLNHALENGRYQGFTPFMDSLIRQGLYFDAFANGKTSIQGIPAVLSSIPSLMNESFIQSNYASGKYTSIAGLLKSKGYTSAFFHGGTNGTMGFDSYTKLVGFDHYYGRSEYNNERDYDGKWGIRDEEFFQFTARTLNGFKQPFVASVFSLSSHHPYFVPGKYAHIFRKGKLPIQQSIMYSDYSLGEFFHTIQHMPWYKNTLFVITADHTSEGYYPYYQSDVGQYAIPLLFYKPGSKMHGKSPLIAQQTDIMPTVLDYLGYERDFLAFGNDLFDSTDVHFSIHYISGLYGLVKNDHYLEFDGTKATSIYDLKQDPLQKTNLVNKTNEKQKKMELFMKAFIQQYNNRIVENRLILEDR